MSISDTTGESIGLKGEGGVLFAIAKYLKAVMKGLQLGRMIQVLHELSDSELENMGMRRKTSPFGIIR